MDRAAAVSFCLVLALAVLAALVRVLLKERRAARLRHAQDEQHLAELTAELEEERRVRSALEQAAAAGQQRHAEERLRESEARWRSLVETLPLLVWTAAGDGTIEYLSTQVCLYTGRTEHELLGEGWAEAIHPDDLARTARSWLAAIEKEQAHEVEHRIRRWDGEYRWFTTRAVAVRDGAGRVFKWFGTSTDITSSKELETELRHAKELLELGIRGSNVAIFDFDMPDGKLESARQTFVNVWETLGYDAATAPSEFAPGAALAIHPDDLARVGGEISAYLAGTGQHFEAEYRVRHRDGSVLWRLARGTALRAADGTPTRFIGSFFDITDRKRAEDALALSQRNFKLWIDTIPTLAWSTQADGVGEFFNQHYQDFMGLPSEQLRDGGWKKAVHPDDLRGLLDAWEAIMASGERGEAEARLRRFDGEYRWLLFRANPLRDEANEIIQWYGINFDIEDRKRAEAERAKLEAELRHAKELLELGVRGSKVSIFEFDMPDGEVENARQTMINLWESLGYDPATAPQRFAPGSELAIHPDDLGRVRAEVRSYLDGKRPDFEMEFRVRHRDGTVFWHLARGVAYRDAFGKPVRFIGSFVDITSKKEVEQRHRESEQRWQLLTETLPQLVWSANAQGAGEYFSTQAEQFIGLPESELVGAGWLNAVHPDDRAHTVAAWTQALEAESLYDVDFRIRRADGAYRWFTTRAEPLRDAAGRVFKWVGTCTDIEGGKQLAEELRLAKERLELAIRSANLCIWEYDMPDGNFANARETLTNVWESLGYGVADAPRGLAAVVHPEDLPRVNELINACLSGLTAAFEAEHRVRHQDGAYHWILGRGVTLRNAAGTPVRFVGTSIDINDIKRIEADLLRAREAAESANRAKDEFLANVSHEIRTPMNAILGMTELALDSARTEHQRELLSTVRSAARNLLNIINDLLDFSKIAAGKLALDEAFFSLRAVLGDTVRALAPRAHRKGLELISQVHADVPDALFGDAGRLRQVLLNLIGNALKFTARGEVVVGIRIAPGSSAPETLVLSFSVRDTGIGIAREKQAAIFRAFEQEDSSTTRKYGGTGLGLTISSQLVALMGGEISVESEPGRGSTFGFTARFGHPSRAELSPGVSAESLEHLRVLVVDDNETNRKVLVERLTQWRMRPASAGDARSAVEALKLADESGAPFALVLLDARMPDVDGITLASEIQARFGASSQRLILLSSDDDPELAARSREAGIRAYLLKPFVHSELLETIWAVMNTPGDALSRSQGRRTSVSNRGSRVPLRILVAEDNGLNIALLRELLAQSGYKAEFASDGRAALELAGAERFDLLLLDMHMPEMDGFEVVRAIRERELTTPEHLPIIALTARSSNRDRERCLAAGMDDFLPKPIEADALWTAIDRMAFSYPRGGTRPSRLLDHAAISRACAGRRSILATLCEQFELSLPDHLERVRSALRDGDLSQLSRAAHLLYGTLAAFSTVAGALASTLEDAAQGGERESCTELVSRLEAMSSELLDDVRGLLRRD